MTLDLRVAVVCSSNQNRSMEAHAFLSKKGFKVRSFGSGNQVKLPGPAPDKPNVYDFGVSYEQMYQDLLTKDKVLYTQNGLLHMLDRNRRIKSHPERFQSCYETFDVIFTAEERVYDQVVEGKKYWQHLTHLESVLKDTRYTQNGILHMLNRNRRIKLSPERFQECYESFDIIFTVEERVFDQVLEELASRSPKEISPVHIINIDVQDNHEEATIGAFLICEMATRMSESEDLDNDIDELLQEFESKAQRPILHTVQFY